MNEDRFYYTDDTLYAFVSKHGVYDEETYDYTVIDAQVVAVDMTDGSTNSIPLPGTDLPLTMGVDHSGRMYLLDFGGSTDGFVLNVFSPSGKLLASKTINSSIDGFLGFDATNGNFYYSGDYNWVYWGYDHAMAALKVGNFNGKSIAINDKPITIFYQKWFFDHYGCAEMLSDRYLADLSTFSGEVVSILDSHSIGVNDVTDMATSISLMDSGVSVSTVCLPSKAIALGVRTIESQYENDVDVTGVGPRATYLESSDTLAVQTQSQELSLFKLSTKKRIGTIATSAPIYKVMAASSKLVVLEKTSSGELQVETATIQMPTTIKLAGPKSVVAGGSADYTATLNGNVSLDVHITSSKNGVL
ncbi:MAG: hypothetical protein U0J70_11180, partial [Atopobiaceae bacterium]|nr:hypothetical protein [Atopobiaceae bacterium]